VPDLQVDRAAVQENIGRQRGEEEAKPAPEKNAARKSGRREKRRKKAEEER